MNDRSVGRRSVVSFLSVFILVLGFGSGTSCEASSPSGRQDGDGAEDAGGIAYFKDIHGRATPLRLPLAVNEDVSWLNLVFRRHIGPKARVSIGGIEIGSGCVESARSGGAEPGGSHLAEWIERAVTAAVSESHRFEVVAPVERVPDPAEHEGPVASYVIQVSVVECGLRLAASEVSASFKVTQAETGQVLFAKAVRSRIDASALTSRGAADSLASGGELAIVQSAIRANVNKGVYHFAEWVDQRPWTGTVVAVEAGWVTIDAGARQGLTTAMILRALVSGRDLIDPESGLILGSVSERVGRLQIVEVRENLAIATILEGCEGIQRGDRVELQDQPAVPVDRPPGVRTG